MSKNINNLDLRVLRAIAESMRPAQVEPERIEANVSSIAAISPTIVLALLDELEEAYRALAAFRLNTLNEFGAYEDLGDRSLAFARAEKRRGR